MQGPRDRDGARGRAGTGQAAAGRAWMRVTQYNDMPSMFLTGRVRAPHMPCGGARAAVPGRRCAVPAAAGAGAKRESKIAPVCLAARSSAESAAVAAQGEWARAGRTFRTAAQGRAIAGARGAQYVLAGRAAAVRRRVGCPAGPQRMARSGGGGGRHGPLPSSCGPAGHPITTREWAEPAREPAIEP